MIDSEHVTGTKLLPTLILHLNVAVKNSVARFIPNKNKFVDSH